MRVKDANTKARLWERIAEARDSKPELSKLRLILSKNKNVSDALEEFLYSHYHFLLTSQRFEPDQYVRDTDIASANAVASLAQLIFKDEVKQQEVQDKPAQRY